VSVINKKCEGCQLKEGIFGLRSDGKKRWCTGCAKAHHPETVDLRTGVCEDCKVNAPSRGLADGKKRWCAGCSKAHLGSMDVKHKKCEGCGLKIPSFGLAAEGKRRRWCSGCAPEHATSVRNVRAPPKKEKKPEKVAKPRGRPKGSKGKKFKKTAAAKKK
jgi:hypothetical protein